MARAKSRKALLVVLGALGAVPVASGLTGILGGPERVPGGAPAAPSVDSEYRFVNTFWTAAGLTLWWSLRHPEQRAVTTRLVLATAAAGGVPRLISARRVGAPHPVFRAATVLELVVVPLVLVWHAVVMRDQTAKKLRTPSTTRSTSASVRDGNSGSDSSCS